jgi:hypothetical protein
MLRHVFIIITIIEKVPLPLYDSGNEWAEFVKEDWLDDSFYTISSSILIILCSSPVRAA